MSLRLRGGFQVVGDGGIFRLMVRRVASLRGGPARRGYTYLGEMGFGLGRISAKGLVCLLHTVKETIILG